MPLYLYKCEECDDEFTVIHSMGHDLEKKEGCNRNCVLNRIPQITQSHKLTTKKQKAGKLVDQYIKETKRELKEEKKRLEREIEI